MGAEWRWKKYDWRCHFKEKRSQEEAHHHGRADPAQILLLQLKIISHSKFVIMIIPTVRMIKIG